ncbi:lipopolysaccharide biosynthesis protein [Fusobacterium sp.]|uniref:lipopolysaccharide biosynthesis protein n=1 Tax=Fusobacterium sp. TaxID=68766 RepID=UPI00396C56BF
MRTQKSIINLITGVISILIISFGKFFLTKVFIDKLGVELNGLCQIFIQISAYLSLAEGGMGTALVFALYKPLAEGRKQDINRILFAAKKVYRYVGSSIFVISIPVAIYLNKFINTSIEKKELTILFFLYILRIVVDYFTNISRFLLQADQKEYKINFIMTKIRIIDMILQYILLVKGTTLEIIFLKDIVIVLLINLFVEKKVKEEYSWIKSINSNLNYSFLKHVKYLVIHTLCSAVVYNTDYIVLGKFTNLTDVTIYSSYLMIINFAIAVPIKGINSLGASIGNLISEGNRKSLKQVYLELFNITFYVTSILSIGLYFLITDFIRFWLGEKFALDKLSVIMLFLIYVHSLTRQPVGIIINSKGLFKQTRNSVILEMVLNLILSIYFVTNYGIRGVIFGTLLAHLLSNFWYYPWVCYKYILKERVKNYWTMYIKNVIEMVGLFIIINIIVVKYFSYELNLFQFMIKIVTIGSVTLIIQTIYYYFYCKSFKDFLNRIYNVIFHK